MTRHQQQIGNHGQTLAASALSALGIEMVEHIATPVHLIAADRTRKYYRVVYGEKVSGDHRGVLPGGMSVLAETKTILDRNLRFSDLREHQPARLTEHAKHGGLSLLVWVHHTGIYILQWPIVGFTKGESIPIEFAAIVATTTADHIRTLIDIYQDTQLAE